MQCKYNNEIDIISNFSNGNTKQEEFLQESFSNLYSVSSLDFSMNENDWEEEEEDTSAPDASHYQDFRVSFGPVEMREYCVIADESSSSNEDDCLLTLTWEPIRTTVKGVDDGQNSPITRHPRRYPRRLSLEERRRRLSETQPRRHTEPKPKRFTEPQPRRHTEPQPRRFTEPQPSQSQNENGLFTLLKRASDSKQELGSETMRHTTAHSSFSRWSNGVSKNASPPLRCRGRGKSDSPTRRESMRKRAL